MTFAQAEARNGQEFDGWLFNDNVSPLDGHKYDIQIHIFEHKGDDRYLIGCHKNYAIWMKPKKRETGPNKGKFEFRWAGYYCYLDRTTKVVYPYR